MSKYTTLLLALGVAAFAGCSDDEPSTNNTPADTGTGTLYDRLGKKTGIAAAVDAIVADELKDPEIAAFFSMNDGTKAGHPSAVQIKECLVLQLGNAAGGPEVYPGKVSGDFMCRDMKTSHANIAPISTATFDKFVTIAAGTLKRLGVADADIATIGTVLNSTKSTITTASTVGADAGT